MTATTATVFLQTTNFIDAAYIVAFGLMIYGMSGLTGPRTAVRGNQTAAVGMAVAVVATLLRKGEFHGSATVWLIIAGVAIGAAVGIPAARNVKMTAMPQMVALFNGVGGGAVALIAWVEFRHGFTHDGLSPWPLRVEIFELFGAIVGSISFWGSNIAFGKLQEILPGRPIKLPGAAQSLMNLVLLVVAVGSAVVLCAGTHSQALFIVGILVCAGLLGNTLVLPIGGADMPVVISLLNAFTGLSAAATGVALSNPVMIVAGMIVGASGTILTDQMAKAMNRSVPSIIAGGLRRRGRRPGRRRRHARRRWGRAGDERRRCRDPALLRPPGRRRARVWDGGRSGPTRRARARTGARGQGRRGQVRDPPRRRADARPHERAARRGGCPL